MRRMSLARFPIFNGSRSDFKFPSGLFPSQTSRQPGGDKRCRECAGSPQRELNSFLPISIVGQEAAPFAEPSQPDHSRIGKVVKRHRLSVESNKANWCCRCSIHSRKNPYANRGSKKRNWSSDPREFAAEYFKPTRPSGDPTPCTFAHSLTKNVCIFFDLQGAPLGVSFRQKFRAVVLDTPAVSARRA
jgi:hypothetical protein